MKKPVIIIGQGEMGGVFGRALLRNGHPVYPVIRGTDIESFAVDAPDPELILIAVAEKDLQSVLQYLPDAWRKSVGLLQNELLPRDWKNHNLVEPTIISVWFEKKKGQDAKVLLPSPAYGPKAALLCESLQAIDIASREVGGHENMLFELVLKNVYILTTNVAGLEVGGNVGELWSQHETFARAVASDVMDLQAWLTGKEFDREQLIQGMVAAFNGDLQHMCMGRSASARLQRALALAENANLEVPTLRDLAGRHLHQ